MGKWHARYAVRAGAEVVGVVDRDATIAQSLATATGARALQVEEDWLGTCTPDVVHICTPWHTHVELCRAALRAGAHVIVEKPVADSGAAARELAALAHAQGRLLVPVHQFPFQAGMAALRLRLGELGTLRSVEFVTFTAGADSASGAARRRIALDILPHPLSLFRALGFTPSALEYRLERFSDDALELAWQRGPTRLSARIDLCARPTCNEMRVAGDEGTAVADLFHGYAIFDRAGVDRRSKLLRPFRLATNLLAAASGNLLGRAWRREPAYPGLPELIQQSYRAARDGTAPPIEAAEYCLAAELNERLAPCGGITA